MLDIDKLIRDLDGQLYDAVYFKRKVDDMHSIWRRIKNDLRILKEATRIKRNNWNTEDTVKGITICDQMLVDYRNIDKDIYKGLINTIYTNRDIARTCINSEVKYSFLLMSLWNLNLKLDEAKKAFAVSEAMNMYGTTKPNDHDSTKVHGRGYFDIRYWILRNPNWTLEEKQKLVMEFWEDDEVYDNTLDAWELAVYNNPANYMNADGFTPFGCYELLHEWDYDQLLNYYDDKETADSIWEEISFCRKMHELRPQQWEIRKANINIQICTTKGDLKPALEGINKFLEKLTENGEFTATLKSIDGYSSKTYQKKK